MIAYRKNRLEVYTYLHLSSLDGLGIYVVYRHKFTIVLKKSEHLESSEKQRLFKSIFLLLAQNIPCYFKAFWGTKRQQWSNKHPNKKRKAIQYKHLQKLNLHIYASANSSLDRFLDCIYALYRHKFTIVPPKKI